MLQTWRWFGPDDPVSLENVAQAGAAGVVSALHHMNQGEVWSEDEVSRRQGEIEAAGLPKSWRSARPPTLTRPTRGRGRSRRG